MASTLPWRPLPALPLYHQWQHRRYGNYVCFGNNFHTVVFVVRLLQLAFVSIMATILRNRACSVLFTEFPCDAISYLDTASSIANIVFAIQTVKPPDCSRGLTPHPCMCFTCAFVATLRTAVMTSHLHARWFCPPFPSMAMAITY